MKITFLSFSIMLNIFDAHIFTLGKKCGPSEYESRVGECCPMCSQGTVVHRDCVGDSSTTCIPCFRGTFMNEPNGLNKCFACETCDKEQGLEVSQSCTTVMNTVCKVLEGYHCKDRNKYNECTFALKHSQCAPGEETKAPGTESSDTVCEACPPGFYSPLGVNCTKWTDCSDKDEVKYKEGSSVEDVQCKPKSRGRRGLIFVPCLPVLCGIFLFVQHCKNTYYPDDKTPVEETGSRNKAEENTEEDTPA